MTQNFVSQQKHMTKEETKNWFENLIAECNSLAERFGLDDFHMSELRQFVERIAREQYKNGTKSGYWWAKTGEKKAAAAAASA
jgi:cytosine/adenosine deaminase-related metal-dependent hydrolase